jgi:hypothetical protein
MLAKINIINIIFLFTLIKGNMSDNQNDKIDNSVKSETKTNTQINDVDSEKLQEPVKRSLMDELKYKFSYLNDLKPDDAKSQVQSNNIVDDNFVHKLNPTRFAFYQEFIREIQKNPELLKKIIYENKMIKHKKEDEDKMIENIVNNLEGLYRIPEKTVKYIDAKKKKMKYENDNIVKQLEKIISHGETLDSGFEYQENSENITEKKKNILKDTFVGGQESTKLDTMKQKMDTEIKENVAKYDKNIKDMKTKFEDGTVLKKFSKKLSEVNDEDLPGNVKAMKLKDIVSDIENDKFTTINSLNISKDDRLLFIGVTFLIRLVSLGIIDWSLSTNFVTSFTSAFVLYIMIYSLFILLILIMVNVQYQVPISELYNSEHSLFTAISGSMYYFYMRPGYFFSSITRFIAHLGIMASITTIAILIKDKDQQKGNLNYNYAEKKRIRKSVHNFTLLMWVFTSSLAMYL